MDRLSKTIKSTDEEEVSKTCEEHGVYISKIMYVAGNKIETKCQKCEKYIIAKRVHREKITEHNQKVDLVTNCLSEFSLPKRFKNKSFDNYIADDEKSKKALAICQKYASTFKDRFEAGGGLVLCGQAGTGKTHLASSIINHIKKVYYIPVFTSALGVTRHVKATYNKNNDKTELQAISDFVRPDLLVIDEVGVQFGTDAEKIILFEVINRRYQEMKPTILISNLNITELGDYIGERVVDRMFEGGGAVIAFDWSSYRRKKQ